MIDGVRQWKSNVVALGPQQVVLKQVDAADSADWYPSSGSW
jgi:hypothetical protein